MRRSTEAHGRKPWPGNRKKLLKCTIKKKKDGRENLILNKKLFLKKLVRRGYLHTRINTHNTRTPFKENQQQQRQGKVGIMC